MNINLLTNQSLLETLDPVALLIGLVLFTLSGFIAASMYRNTNDFKKTLIAAIIIGVILGVFMAVFTKLPIIFIVLFLLYNIVVSAFISNYYFYH